MSTFLSYSAISRACHAGRYLDSIVFWLAVSVIAFVGAIVAGYL